MSDLQVFNNEIFGDIRTLQIEGKIYFVANDIAKALKYAKPNDAIHQHCKYTVKHSIPHPQSKTKTLAVNIIPEGDVYRLITHSKMPSAEKFETWVFDEVLPTIRQTGKYEMKPKSKEQILSEALLIANGVIEELNTKIDNIPITSIQVKQISVQLTMKASQYNKSKEIRKHLEKVLKERFEISTFQEIKTKDYDEVLEFIKGYTSPLDKQLELF